jgi:hypothetical protein
MTTATKAPKATKPAGRTARVQRLNNLLILWITEGKKIDAYKLTPIPADFGVGIELQKADQGSGENEAYQVNVIGRDSLCCCKGSSTTAIAATSSP